MPTCLNVSKSNRNNSTIINLIIIILKKSLILSVNNQEKSQNYIILYYINNCIIITELIFGDEKDDLNPQILNYTKQKHKKIPKLGYRREVYFQ